METPDQDTPPLTPRPGVGFLALVFFPTLVLVDTAVAVSRGWGTHSGLDRALLILCALVLGGGTFAWFRRRDFYERQWPNILLAVLSGFLAWALAEAAVGFRFDRNRFFHLRRPGSHIVFKPDPKIVPGVHGESHFTVNSDGVRGDPMPPRADAYRILAVGGSTTECVYLDDREAWSGALQDMLKGALPRPVWVGSAGQSGFLGIQHERFLASSPLVGEVDAVVLLIGINDMQGAYSGYLDVVRRRMHQESVAPFWDGSDLRNLLREVARRAFSDGAKLEDLSASAYPQRRKDRAAAKRATALPDLAPHLEEYRAVLGRIARAARERGVRLIVATQPTLWDADLTPEQRALLWLGRLDDGTYLTVEQARTAMDRYNQVLREVAAREGLELVDLSPMDGEIAYYFDDCHFTEAGAAEVARRVAEHLKATGLAPPAG